MPNNEKQGTIIKKYCLSNAMLKTADFGKWLVKLYENPEKIRITEEERQQVKNTLEEIKTFTFELIDW